MELYNSQRDAYDTIPPLSSTLFWFTYFAVKSISIRFLYCFFPAGLVIGAFSLLRFDTIFLEDDVAQPTHIDIIFFSYQGSL